MATEKPVNPEGKIKEWEAGFRGFQRSMETSPQFERESNMKKDKMKTTDKDREDDRKSALKKLERMVSETSKSCKACKAVEPIKKDMEEHSGKFNKIDAASPTAKPSHVMGTASTMGWGKPAMGQTGAEAKHALATASPGKTSSKPKAGGISPFHATPEQPGTPKTVSVKPMAAVAGGSPKPAGSHSDSGDVMTSVPKTFKSMTKSAIVDLMIAKARGCEQAAGNPANESGPVSGFGHGGKARAQTSVAENRAEQFAGNPSQEQTSVSGHAHGGKGPEKTSVSGNVHGGKGPAETSIPANGTEQFAGNPSQIDKAHGGKSPAKIDVKDEAHGGKGKKQKDVDGPAAAGCPENMAKAATSMSVPRLPRAMATAMDTWRSATNVLTRRNSAVDLDKNFTHHGAGPLFPGTAQEIDDEAQQRATRPPEMFKSCQACGRTYRIQKSMDEPCPSCVGNENSCMAKSRGGYLIPSALKY
jgi:hypothetical protein